MHFTKLAVFSKGFENLPTLSPTSHLVRYVPSLRSRFGREIDKQQRTQKRVSKLVQGVESCGKEKLSNLGFN